MIQPSMLQKKDSLAFVRLPEIWLKLHVGDIKVDGIVKLMID